MNEIQNFLNNVKKLGAAFNPPSIEIGIVISEEPDLKIKVNDLVLDKEDFLINEYLLTAYKRNFIAQAGKMDLYKEDPKGIGITDSKSGGSHKHDVLHLEGIISTHNGDHVHNIDNQETGTASTGADETSAHKHGINKIKTEIAGLHQHELLNYEPVETDLQEGMSSHDHSLLKIDFDDANFLEDDGYVKWNKVLRKGDLLAVMAVENRQTYIIFCKLVSLL